MPRLDSLDLHTEKLRHREVRLKEAHSSQIYHERPGLDQVTGGAKVRRRHLLRNVVVGPRVPAPLMSLLKVAMEIAVAISIAMEIATAISIAT